MLTRWIQERDLALFLQWKLEVEEILLEIFAIICSQRVKQFCDFQEEIGLKTYCASLLYLNTLKH